MAPDSAPVKYTLASFKALKAFAKFDGSVPEEEGEKSPDGEDIQEQGGEIPLKGAKLGLSYTINLNLPATSDIAVFNAIFKSLREHLLR
jgi:hypothetical protein